MGCLSLMAVKCARYWLMIGCTVVGGLGMGLWNVVCGLGMGLENVVVGLGIGLQGVLDVLEWGL